MEYLQEIENLIIEYKTKYKPIGLYPVPSNPDDPEDFLREMRENYTEDVHDGKVVFEIEVNSIEEFGFLIHYLREKSGVKILGIDEFEFASYNPDTQMRTYESPEDLSEGVFNGTILELMIDENRFPKFWKEFLDDFLLPLKYLPRSQWFLDYYKQHNDL